MTNRFDRWQPVVDAVNARMDDLGLIQADVVKLSGLSDPTVRAFMTGKFRGVPREPVPTKLCRGLGWSTDSVKLILAGQKPIEVSRPAAPTEWAPQSLVAEVNDLTRKVIALTADVRAMGGEVERLRREDRRERK